MEASHQRTQGFDSYCEEIKEESLEEAITRQ
jgi:hypothetical protein